MASPTDRRHVRILEGGGDATLVPVGEISLAGEIRPVAAAARRTGEAKRLGYTHLVDESSGPLREALRVAFAETGAGRGRDGPEV